MITRQYNKATQLKWYSSARWRKLRKRVVAEHPMCQCPKCNEMGLEANIADHIEPHRGDPRLFFNRSNLQALNKHCHDSWKQKLEGGRGATKEKRRRPALYNKDGTPVAGDHHWNEGDDSEARD